MLRPVPDHLPGFLTGIRVNHGATLSDNPRFFPGDGCQRVTQILHMIQSHMGDDRNLLGAHGVGGVQPAAQPCLQNAVIRLCLGKNKHGHEKQILKKSGMVTLSRLQSLPVQLLVNPQKSCQKCLPANHLPVYHKALPQVHQMGGGKHRHPPARRLQYAPQIGADRAFAVGPRHMKDAQPGVRIPQPAQKRPGVLQGILSGKPGDIHNIIHRLIIGSDPLFLHIRLTLFPILYSRPIRFYSLPSAYCPITPRVPDRNWKILTVSA